MERMALYLGMIGLCGLVAACTTTSTPSSDRVFGDSVRALRAQQVVDPNAPTKNTGLAPTDGKVAAGAMRGVNESYKGRTAVSDSKSQ